MEINSIFLQDFFTDDLWTRIPNEWKNFLEDLTPAELSCFLLDDPNSKAEASGKDTDEQ